MSALKRFEFEKEKSESESLNFTNMKLIFTSTNCSSANDLNERVNQTLANYIRCKFNSADSRAWTKIAEDYVNKYNEMNHRATKFLPNHLLYVKISPIILEQFLLID